MPGKYTAKLLYVWDDKKFDEEYLKKLERNWNRWNVIERECGQTWTRVRVWTSIYCSDNY